MLSRVAERQKRRLVSYWGEISPPPAVFVAVAAAAPKMPEGLKPLSLLVNLTKIWWWQLCQNCAKGKTKIARGKMVSGYWVFSRSFEVFRVRSANHPRMSYMRADPCSPKFHTLRINAVLEGCRTISYKWDVWDGTDSLWAVWGIEHLAAFENINMLHVGMMLQILLGPCTGPCSFCTLL